jgi:hypothetical protein
MASSPVPGRSVRPYRPPNRLPGVRELLPSAQRASQPAPLLDLPPGAQIDDSSVPHDHHVRLTEERCMTLLRRIGWVFVAGSTNKAPELIRPRRLDHLGGC